MKCDKCKQEIVSSSDRKVLQEGFGNIIHKTCYNCTNEKFWSYTDLNNY